MRVAHFDPFSGISGDMTLGALFDAGVPVEPVVAGVASLNLPVKLRVDKVRKGGFAATQVTVEAPHQHAHRHLADVERILSAGKLSDQQRDLALAIFRRLAQAEATVHGMAIEKVHFHEVGALDSLADIAGAAIALDLLGVERFTSGPVPTGSGTVRCAHGVMPVPAPGTAELLKGVPLRPSSLQSELTTPTGAAILTTVVSAYVDQPSLTIERIGHGAGSRDLAEQPNVLRLFVGTASAPAVLAGTESDEIWVLETNLDDVPGEVVGYCQELLFAAGALDVFTTAIQMKKNRPGVLLSVLAPADKIAALEEILFRETLTFGIRRHSAQRDKLRRGPHTVETAWGPIAGKLGMRDGKTIWTPEYEACVAIAKERGLALYEVQAAAVRGFDGAKYEVRSTKYEKKS